MSPTEGHLHLVAVTKEDNIKDSFTLCDFFLVATAIPLIATNGLH